MVFHRVLIGLLSSILLVSFCSVAAAQGQGPPTTRVESRAVQLANGQHARMDVTWAADEDDCSIRLLVAQNAPITIHDGCAAGTIVTGHGRLLVVYATDHASTPFRIRISENRGNSPFSLTSAISVLRPSGQRGTPFAVVATPIPDGFAVFFQEVELNDPTAAHTYLLRLDQQGSPRGQAQEVAIPWSLADAIWNGQGFHLALLYPGNGTDMRLSMVSTTADGRPQQHPDWSSRAGYISDVHLVSESGVIRAYYRGGSGGDRLQSSDVTNIRSWGQEPTSVRNHGALSDDQVIIMVRRQGQIVPARADVN